MIRAKSHEQIATTMATGAADASTPPQPRFAKRCRI
jgi:hypothetical protein